ncbi:threonylcarbamoyl-AMP synthase [Patescibacteria group bacterium]|nr:threonylcarbamoyl-AMP synthase [Patescibacteria group bacterium]
MQSSLLSQQDFPRVVKKATAALLKGKVLVCPTDTVYGLLADATSRKAVQKVFLVKGREKGKPLPIFVKDIAMAKTLAKVSFLQEKYMRRVWPGKVTLVLKSRGKLPRETGTAERIGLRIPKYAFVQQLLANLSRPLTGTSANLAGKPSLFESKKVIVQFQKRRQQPDIMFDAGKLSRSHPSKVLDITGIKPKVLRK